MPFKLLGLASNDIDVGLSTMMGLGFATLFVDYINSNNEIPIEAKITKIASNPDQSKHLETAKVKLLNTEIDFVNLRSEEYAQGSRIPSEVVCDFFCSSALSFC